MGDEYKLPTPWFLRLDKGKNLDHRIMRINRIKEFAFKKFRLIKFPEKGFPVKTS